MLGRDDRGFLLFAYGCVMTAIIGSVVWSLIRAARGAGTFAAVFPPAFLIALGALVLLVSVSYAVYRQVRGKKRNVYAMVMGIIGVLATVGAVAAGLSAEGAAVRTAGRITLIAGVALEIVLWAVMLIRMDRSATLREESPTPGGEPAPAQDDNKNEGSDRYEF